LGLLVLADHPLIAPAARFAAHLTHLFHLGDQLVQDVTETAFRLAKLSIVLRHLPNFGSKSRGDRSSPAGTVFQERDTPLLMAIGGLRTLALRLAASALQVVKGRGKEGGAGEGDLREGGQLLESVEKFPAGAAEVHGMSPGGNL
jgi:hypothetical protein